ncbi:MAG: SUMF1/EgtB/PvdO family nonheme iron enzyme [Snowella sp.]|nr:SUMF1/EgtB/PvdO family nonheme iron enzyme [Snowella sp.]
MKLLNLFILVKSCDKYWLPYDFYISKYPVAIAENNQIKMGTSDDSNLYRTSWEPAAMFCNALSKQHHLSLAYSEENQKTENLISSDTVTQQSFRLATPREWDYAAHGWSGSKKGDYFPIQKKYFKIPFLDYPITEEQKLLFEQGYSTIDQLIENSIGIFGMLVYAREWCSPIESYDDKNQRGIKWQEYYTNYDNDIGYQTVTFTPHDQENLPFRIVLPC